MSGASALRRYEVPVAAVLVAALLLFTKQQYLGLHQDAVIYGLLALHAGNPASFAADPHFLFGSQAAWTVFPVLQSLLIKLAGIEVSGMLLVLAGAALWFSASWLLTDGIPVVGLRIFAFLLIAAAVWSYSPNFDTFKLNEPFATARTLAIPVALGAIAFFWRSFPRAAWALAILGTLLHPLVAGWVLALLLARPFDDRRVAIGLPVLAALPFLLAFLCFQGPFARIDPPWLEGLRAITRDLLVGGWPEARVQWVLTVLGALWWAARALGGERGRTLLHLVLLSSWAFLVATVASRHFPVLGLVQAQGWRVLWLASVMAVPAVAAAVAAMLPLSRVRAASFALALVLAWRLDALAVLPFVLILGDATPFGRRCLSGAQAFAARWEWVIWFGSISVLVVSLPGYVVDLAILGDSLRVVGWWQGFPSGRGLVLGGGFGVGVAIYSALIASDSTRRVLIICLVPAVIWALGSWDGRSPEQRAIGAVVDRPEVIPAGDSVLLDGHSPLIGWFWLRTAAYAEPEHAIGATFSRERWALVQRRLERVVVGSLLDRDRTDRDTPEKALLLFQRGLQKRGTTLAEFRAYKPTEMRFTPDGLTYLCQDHDLDWVLASSPIGSIPPSLLVRLPLHDRVVAYRCADLSNSTGSN